jgi:uncharacterized protein (TIGR00730 family)
MGGINVNDEKILQAIHDLVSSSGGMLDTLHTELVIQLIQTSLRLMSDGHDVGQMKLMTRALKEMRYAYRIFNAYREVQKISIFGSARTPEDHPDYLAAKEFGALMAKQGWMCITGAANGIMKAGLEGSQTASSFGLSIRLPFETQSNTVLEGDPKLIIFRYFFTRKLMFLSHANAAAFFPGGVGTMDELFEVLTLMQTGRSAVIPVVLVEGKEGGYWEAWRNYIEANLLRPGWINVDDPAFYAVVSSAQEAVDHINLFYRRYHSSRYVKDLLVLRLKEALTDEELRIVNKKFSSIIASGEIRATAALPEESDFLDLPRLVFHHTRTDFSLLRLLIDQINNPCITN